MTAQELGGEPAFPSQSLDQYMADQSGMSTRTWLAGLAMQGMLASETHGEGMLPQFKTNDLDGRMESAAKIVAWADALLTELAKQKP